MHSSIKELFDYLASDECPKHSKEELIKSLQQRFNLTKDRKIYYSDFFAVRISSTKDKKFCNTVLSLSALQKYDSIPVFVILVSSDKSVKPKIMLINSTFIRKISQSSQELRIDNIKGSFNGSDIEKEYQNIKNTDEDFKNAENLFAYHCGLSWKDNLERLVDATSNISAKKEKLEITNTMEKSIFNSIQHAKNFISSKNFNVLNKDLNDRVQNCKNEILIASRIENVNVRGRLIEVLITSSDDVKTKLLQDLANVEQSLPIYDTQNGLGDYNVSFDNGDTKTDIKTKIIYLKSNPKAYNIDKFLQTMSDDKSVFLLYFVGINESGVFNTTLCSVYDSKLLDGTDIQFHWSGRNSRGVTQFRGKIIDSILNQKSFTTSIDDDKAKKWVTKLISQ